MSGITGIGSLPHADPEEAARFVLDTTTVPYLPQLPLRHRAERMLAQWGTGLCGCGLGDGPIGLDFGSDVLAGDEAFLGARVMLEQLPVHTPLVKTQVTGPVTLALGLLAAGRPRAGLEECLVTELTARVDQHVSWITHHLPYAEVMLFFDEPALSGLDTRGFPINRVQAAALLDGVMRAAPVHAGIHCCGEPDWGFVAERDPAWISWDVESLGAAFADQAEAVAAATARGTRIAWGVVPVQAGPPSFDLLDRLQRAVGELVLAGAAMGALTEDALFTPACGLAAVNVGQAERIAETVGVVVGELGEVWAS